MKLTPPFPISTIDNKFGPSPGLNYEAIDGTIGHPGVDFNVSYGTPIPAAIAAPCSAILSKDNPNLMAFRAVNTIYEDETGCYEIQYGHCSSISASVGQNLAQGEVVAEVGNTGDVFSEINGVSTEVTAAEKNAGSHAGSHLHFQVRVITKQTATEPNHAGVVYLNNGESELLVGGFKYYYTQNGYNGCVDPMDFFEGGLEDVVKDEIAVDNQTTDPSVKETLEEQIIEGIEKIIGIN